MVQFAVKCVLSLFGYEPSDYTFEYSSVEDARRDFDKAWKDAQARGESRFEWFDTTFAIADLFLKGDIVYEIQTLEYWFFDNRIDKTVH